jgi:hypothetical protein
MISNLRKEKFMSRIKSLFAVLLLTACVGFVPQANASAPVVKVILAGSSAEWQSLALAAYKTSGCVATGVAPCHHFTSAVNFSLTDSRVPGGIVDSGAIWIVWDSHLSGGASNPQVWAYIKVDSSVGVRCFYAVPKCKVSAPANGFAAVGNLISNAVWGTATGDEIPPNAPVTANVQGLFLGAGQFVGAAATDIRPEDALFATCRANSALGGTSSDALDGLGYNGANASGSCPAFPAGAGGVGNAILSGYPGGTGKANVVAFGIIAGQHDPISNGVIPAGATTVPTGAAPIVFVAERDHELAGVKDATDQQLQSVFSGTNCNANAFGLAAGAIEAFVREPLSGTMNTTEATVFRYPVPAGGAVGGKSQETGVGLANPLTAAGCAGGGGTRSRAIGTGEEVKSVLNAFVNGGHDGIGYTFFSFGNVSSIANQAKYGYLTLNGVDPIFNVTSNGAFTFDPGQPLLPNTLPAAANLTLCGGTLPCPETSIWGGPGLSFPHLRDGTYKAWSALRVVSSGSALTNAKLPL